MDFKQMFLKTYNFVINLPKHLSDFFKSKPTLDSILRVALPVIICLYLLVRFVNSDEFSVLILSIIFSLALVPVSSLVLYGITSVKFTKYFIEGDDNAYSNEERLAVVNLMGKIIISVAIIIGLVCLATYQTRSVKTEINRINTENLQLDSNVTKVVIKDSTFIGKLKSLVEESENK